MKRIIAATKKRWALKRAEAAKAQRTAKKAALKKAPVKKAAKKSAPVKKAAAKTAPAAAPAMAASAQ
jgi:histone H1/5